MTAVSRSTTGFTSNRLGQLEEWGVVRLKRVGAQRLERLRQLLVRLLNGLQLLLGECPLVLDGRLELNDVGSELAAGGDELALELVHAREMLVALRGRGRQLCRQVDDSQRGSALARAQEGEDEPSADEESDQKPESWGSQAETSQRLRKAAKPLRMVPRRVSLGRDGFWPRADGESATVHSSHKQTAA